METISWNSDIESNPDARCLLNRFLTGRFDCKHPPSYNDLVKEDEAFKKYKYDTMRSIIVKFAKQASRVLERRRCMDNNTVENTYEIPNNSSRNVIQKSGSIILPYEVWPWSRGKEKHVTLRIQLLSHFENVSHNNIQCRVQSCRIKVLL